jgi:integrase
MPATENGPRAALTAEGLAQEDISPMHQQPTQRVSGHVRVIERRRGPQFYVKYRLASGRQVQKRLGPVWKGRGRPPEGHYTAKMAQETLDEILTDARRGLIADPDDDSGHTFGEACTEWLRYVEHDRERAPSTVRDYRNVVNGSLLQEWDADLPLAELTTDRIEEYRGRLLAEGRLSRRTVQKVMVLLHGILARAKRRKWIDANPAEDVERVSVKRSGDFNVLAPDQVYAVARAAERAAEVASDPIEKATYTQDAALYVVAAFTGLRMGELRALRWRDIDFAERTVFVRSNFTNGAEKERAPKSGRVRSVPLIDQAAAALDRLSRRERFTEDDDLVFPSALGGYLDDSAQRKRFYVALADAELGHLREKDDPIVFHDLRHTFGTLAARTWELPKVQGYMGHADIQTTMLYVHHQPKTSDADALSSAVAAEIAGDSTLAEAATDGHELRRSAATR